VTVVVLNAGAPMDVSFLDEIPGINALVFFCQQGTEGGSALGDILRGARGPSGRLSDTWPRRYGDIPDGAAYSYLGAEAGGPPWEAEYREGIYVGYRYFDSFRQKPRYPFGYGLSYTEFSLALTGAAVEGAFLSLEAAVTNRGPRPGQEVVQLYVTCPRGKLPREYQSLAAFAKTRALAPGETQALTLRFSLAALAAYDEGRAALVLEPGEYLLRVGTSSRNTTLWAVAVLDREAVTAKLRRVCPPARPVAEIAAPGCPAEAASPEAPRLSVKAADFPTFVPAYTEPPTRREEILQTLTPREMTALAVGAGDFAKPYFTVPGAAGYTTSALVGKGIFNGALCDGPAGLRLQRTSALTKGGGLKGIDAPMGVFQYLPKIVKGFFFGDARKGKRMYQYATAFPVGCALAQSWNAELLEAVGRAIGEEMTEYGVTFWLGPGLNLHRNPLCGRNYEYFSEDPLLTGKLAAAVTRGVQSWPGRFATLKHFAANNQEYNRSRVSSNMSERALREMYLRAFEIALREGGALGVMTSYNRLNGQYTANSHDLCTKVLRNEWGFAGLVMTDWLATGRGLADNAAALISGNDLIMPGGFWARRSLGRALKTGALPLEALRRCCGNILEVLAQGVYDT
jgi:beta-glucosidase